MWERIGVKPCVEGGRIRQCTAAVGAPMVYGAEVFEYEAKPECVLSWQETGLHHEGVGRRGAHPLGNEAAGERGHSYEAMDGSTVCSSGFGRGAQTRPAVGTCFY